MINTVATILGAILGAILAGPVSYWFAKRMVKDQSFDAAATKFRSTILYELNGIYPVLQYWSSDKGKMLSKTIPRILSAVAEFQFYASDKKGLTLAANGYVTFCINAFSMDFITLNPVGMSNRIEFEKIVDHLLAFSNKKQKSFFYQAPLIRRKIQELKEKVVNFCSKIHS